MKNYVYNIVLFLFFFISILHASNEISVKDPTKYGAKPGYIEKATLVVEPFGSYVEQSLYLEYSDRKQFDSDLLEIVHRFELPKDAVINDLWLWIGDSVMQAQMLDTWSARAIYDSIVATKYDPAFLAKNGSQYELRIYPLASGSYRKVKLTFIVPTKWYGNEAVAELPIKLLKSNNSTVKPLEILFRYQNNIWGNPSIDELPDKNFIELLDTLNYHYNIINIADISNYSSLNLRFNTDFKDGYYISGYHDKSDSTFFQLGILPKEFFNVIPDSSGKDVLVALDFSGSFRKDFENKLPIYQSVLENALKPNDNFKFFICGNQKINDYTDGFIPASAINISNVFLDFMNSDLADEISQYYLQNILFCDQDASTNWNFNNLSSITNVKEYQDISGALDYITKSDVVAAYRHGFDDPIDNNLASKVIERLDSLFSYGGRFLTYYDYNREYGEILAKHYINGLKVKSVTHDAVTLYRNIEGNIGKDFPESFTRNASYFLEYNDPDVKVELRDNAGNAAVISKKIKNGLIVVTGIWSLRDDAAMKTLLGAPLLGINSNKNPYQLDDLLARIKTEYDLHNFSKSIIFSDSDSLLTINDAEQIAINYKANFQNGIPKFLTVNLLDNDLFLPNYIIEGQEEYYGSGYLLKKIAEVSNGIHFEKHNNDWQYISSVFSPYNIPIINELEINTEVDNGIGEIYTLREVNQLNDPNKPRFFLGVSNAMNKMTFNISAKFAVADKDSTGSITFLVPHDTTTYNKIISSMLGNEEIKDHFYSPPIDTSEVVQLSLRYNLLTDFTALLALEPNDTFHFLRDPLDEGGLSGLADLQEISDSISIAVFPNPFNNMTTIKFIIKNPSNVLGTIYNILGEKVFDLTERFNISGEHRVIWYGKNNYGSNVSSGFYILRVVLTDVKSSKQTVHSQKLLYLK